MATHQGYFPLREHSISIRVRYQETDGQGRVHHANYINFFEVGRIELLRAAGYSYRELEAAGVYLVVSEISCEYYGPARYDDCLELKTLVVQSRGTRIEHRYEVSAEGRPIASGRSVVASVDQAGKVCRLPQFLRLAPE
jgi:acyl-CoA thioester hydrolase